MKWNPNAYDGSHYSIMSLTCTFCRSSSLNSMKFCFINVEAISLYYQLLLLQLESNDDSSHIVIENCYTAEERHDFSPSSICPTASKWVSRAFLKYKGPSVNCMEVRKVSISKSISVWSAKFVTWSGIFLTLNLQTIKLAIWSKVMWMNGLEYNLRTVNTKVGTVDCMTGNFDSSTWIFVSILSVKDVEVLLVFCSSISISYHTCKNI